jgi:transcription-repair coupling factor (superfamily II helicase)
MEILEKRIHKIIARISDVADFRRIAADALRGDTEVVVSGLSGSARALFITGLWQSLRRPLIVVTPQDRGVEALATDVAYFHGELNANGADRVAPFPAWETDPYAGLAPHADIQQTRATTLWRLHQKQVDIVVASMRSLSTRLVSPSQFDTYSLHVATGDDLSQDLLMEHLSSAGYLRQEPVGAPGEFSIRGGIVDIFSPLMRNPVRIEFFGDSVDSIREFDLDDQRSRGPVQRIDILPMQDVVISREMLRAWGGRARERWRDESFEKDLNEKLVFADNGEVFPGAPYWMPIVQPMEFTLFDYAESAVLIFDEPEVLQETYEKFFAVLEQRFEQTMSAGGVALPPQEIFLSPEDFRGRASQHRVVYLEELGASGSSFFVRGQPAEKFHGRIKEMAAAVGQSHQAGRDVILLGSTVGMAERLRDILHEYGIPFRCEFGEQPLKVVDDVNLPIVGIGKISSGLRLPDAGLEIYAETDIFDESEHLPQQHRRRQKISSFVSDLQDLKTGDYVVHVDHGIGTYNGLTLVHDKECMVLLYQGGDRLYVPLERLDLVQKYSSTEGARPQLDKLGGTTWIARKTRV